MTQTKADVAVIGSGISGLTAAALLAKQGRKVVILEQNRTPGGALRRFKRQGVSFDVGFHYSGGMGNDEILRVLWEYLGVWPHLTVCPFPAEGSDLVHFKKSGRVVRAFFSYKRLEEELGQHFPTERQAIATYLKTIREICQNVPFFNLDLPLTPFLRDAFYPAGKSVADYLQSLTDNQELQSILASPVFLYGVTPQLASMSMHASVAHGFYSGAYAIDNGGQGIVDAYLKVLADYGVEIITSCRAENLIIDNGQARGVMTEGRRIETKQVIFTGHPAGLFDLVPDENFRPAFCSRIRDLADTASMFIVFGAVDDPEKLAELKWLNYYQIPPGLDILEANNKNPGETALLITAPGGRDLPQTSSSTADRGVILMKPADWQEASRFAGPGRGKRLPGYDEWKTMTTEKIMQQARELWPGSVDITPLASGTPLTCRDELGSPEGGIYGIQHNRAQFSPSARTKVPGLFLSGQNTLMAGVMGAALSGLVTAAEIEGLETLWEKVTSCR